MSEFFDPASYQFSTYAVPVVVVGVITWALGLATFIRERASRLSRSFIALTGAVGLLYVSNGFAYSAVDVAVAEGWVRFSVVGTVFLPVTILGHVSASSVHYRKIRPFIIAEYMATVAFAGVVVATDWLVEDVHRYFWGFYPIFGPAGVVLAGLNFVSFAAGAYLFRAGMRTTHSPTHRKRVRVRLLALALAIPASVDYLPTFHIGIYPFGWIFILGFACASTYTIWRYRMVDITPALAATQILGTMAEGLVVVDRDGNVRLSNPAADAMYGQSRSLVGLSCRQLDEWHPDARLSLLLDPETGSQQDVTYHTPDGSTRTAVMSSSRLLDHLSEWVGTVFIIHDITERWEAEAALRQSEERFRSLVQNASDLITVIDADTTIRYQSPSIEYVLGRDAGAVVGTRLSDIVHPDDVGRLAALLNELLGEADRRMTGDMRIRHRDGSWRHVEFMATDQRQNAAIHGFVLNLWDVTERRALEHQLRHQALHDPLTGLANRTRFADRLEHALVRTTRSGKQVAVMFIDLDNFKGINDSLGHTAGDRLLAGVAERIQGCVRPVDTVARLGGDEFAVLLEDVDSLEDARVVADRIFAALDAPFELNGKEILARSSMGIATSRRGSQPDVESLLRDADLAMYAAKSRGRNRYEVFEDTMQSTMMERLELLTDLQSAVESQELLLHYQPMILLDTGQLYGVEALMRWQHPRRGLLAPADFIPLAEESGAIIELGRWALSQACRQAVAWQRAYPGLNGWTLSVNVSVKQLQHPEFVDDVRHILQETGMIPSRLILELTETMMMQDLGLMMSRLRELKTLDVQLAIDDFGTGYSSLSYLQNSPFDLLKIDKSFIDDVGEAERQKEVTRAIIELGKSLEMELVAEGIERSDQLSSLKTLDCDLGQGFLFSRPLEPDKVGEMFAELADEGSRAA
jgi:diguanylate cyclase (GGDEF)-like protein/PAS domain S-box-containing protein